ncbi:hypothetical protein [Mucilaginibacter auburnensis]|uniref:Uncharacterized protein n=1 Tax=Mucilaginibacter auburnensis TaxID=1457233 RepID=A0A2H9VM06_9SPHI|nr:hypothetical protein [Mucilaginibacter auburnensis]PJJ79335.1 hypothetical protein CLV57_2467 [Mucilaginibacter auburnensis]
MLSTIKITSFILISFLLFTINGCEKPAEEGIYKDKAIPTEKASMLHNLNNNLFKAIKTDRDDAELLCSTDFLKQKNIKVQFDYINKLRNEDEYVLLKDYYIVNGGDERSGLIAIDHPEVKYVPLAKEMYMAFFVPKHKQNKLMLTVVYGKFEIGWKANEISLAYYTQRGKTSTELLDLAKEEYSKGYLVNAINNIMMAANATSSKYLKNPHAEEISTFSQKVIDEANAKISYPLTLSEVSTKPKIISISSNAKEDEFLQYIYYITNLKIADTGGLKRENNEIKKALPKIFPGIDKGEKTILYSAMSQKPVVGEAIPHFDVTEKISH